MRDTAIRNIHPNVTTINGGVEAWDKDDNVISLDESAITTEITRLQAEYDALEYSRNRKAEYPDWSVQLEKIYDDGIDKWKTEMVDPVKAKYPKPD